MKRPQSGFTLVEIAIVLVVIGLLLGGVLKGQELIASARVRNLSDQQAGIQAAFYGFQDRYRAIPGDMDPDEAANAIGVDPDDYDGGSYAGGDANGLLGNATGDDASGDSTSGMTEPNALWLHLSDSGFIRGTYSDGASNSDLTADHGPQNVFNGNLVLARHDGYEDDGSSTPARLLLHMGRRVPVDIAREFDVKVDDGFPRTGVVRGSPLGTAMDTTAYERDPNCIANAEDPIWNVADNSQDCNPVYLF